MKLENLNPDQQVKASDESHELDDVKLDGVAGGATSDWEDPRLKDHSDKKDDPKDW